MRSLFLLLLFTLPLSAVEFKATNTGIEIGAGSLGSFTLTDPEFEPPHKIIEVKVVSESVVLRYEGGAECVVSAGKDEIGVIFKGVTADVKSWKMTTLIDIGFAKGGLWQIADKKGVFPAEKASPPQIASLNGTTFLVKNAQGQSLSVTTPNFAFQQLTDNREWNWAVYHWQFIVPWIADRPAVKIKVTSDLASVTKLIDPFGQSLKDAFSNKLKSLEDLTADVEADKAYYASIETPKLDRFGGLPGSGEALWLKKTGFFHVEQKSGKSWLVDPDGNAFFHLGVCGFAPNDDFTYVKGREGIYEWLPKLDSEYASAFREGNSDHFSFYIANTIKKFGAAYDFESHAARMIERVKKWGFNSIGAFSPVPQKAAFPYVAHLPINEWEGVPRIPGAHEVWDPFDAITTAKIAANIAREVPLRANDPMLIGWFIVNEPRYDELPRVIPSLDGKHACKRELVATLKAKYGTVEAFNTAWQAKAASFDELVGSGLAVTTDAAKADVKSFVGVFLETYFT